MPLTDKKIPKKDKTIATVQVGQKYGPVITDMTRTGPNNNVISLLGTNGLATANMTALTQASPPYYAFNGWSGASVVNSDTIYSHPNQRYSTSPFSITNQWIKINFGKLVEGISGLKLWHTGFAARAPKNFKLQISTDDSVWNNHYIGLTTNSASFDEYTFDRCSAQYVRLWIDNNWGDATYIEVNDIEIHQDV